MASNEEQAALTYAAYWDEHYSQPQSAQTHEWYRSFDDLEPFFERNLFTSPGHTPQNDTLVMHLGSGGSTIPVDLAARGYIRQLCVDFSPTVVEQMRNRHAATEGIEWRLMDVRDMKGVENASVDAAFDKGTLDSMIHGSPWSPPQEVKDNTTAYLREVHRVLKDSGKFLYVTFRQPHFMKVLSNPDGLWDVEMQILGNEGSFDYYGYVFRKANTEKPACDRLAAAEE